MLKVELLRQLGRFEEAMAMLKQSLGLDPRAEYFRAAIERRGDQVFFMPHRNAALAVAQS